MVQYNYTLWFINRSHNISTSIFVIVGNISKLSWIIGHLWTTPKASNGPRKPIWHVIMVDHDSIKCVSMTMTFIKVSW